MVINQSRSNRKPSGSRYKKQFVRRQHESGGKPALTKIDAAGDKRKQVRTIGGNTKDKQLVAANAHVMNPKTNKVATEKIITVKENAANRHFVRRNIITKGTIIETEKGLARVTSRPGQSGLVQAVRVE